VGGQHDGEKGESGGSNSATEQGKRITTVMARTIIGAVFGRVRSTNTTNGGWGSHARAHDEQNGKCRAVSVYTGGGAAALAKMLQSRSEETGGRRW